MKLINITFAIVLSLISSKLVGQQLAHSTFFEDAKHFWNPAAMGTDNRMKTSLFFRQQWLSFSQAPRTGFLSFQFPFVDLNMSAGAIVNFDQSGPVSKKGLQLVYAYKLKDILGDNSQLSLGINAGFQQYAFNPDGQVYNDLNDPLLNSSNNSSLYPALSGGFYYLSNTDEYDGNVFFVGLAFRDVFTTDVLIQDRNQERINHLHLNVGTRVYQQYSYIEPSITVNYSQFENLDIRAGIRYEMENTFWAGLGYSTLNEVNIQGGIVIPEFGDRDGALRIGAIGNIGITDKISTFGPGVEIFVGYHYDLD